MLKGHIALVTGAGSGIGRATCHLFAEEGATVVAADIDQQQALHTVHSLAGKDHLGVKLDVTKGAEIEGALAEIKSKYSSPPTVTVNCAGLHLSGSFLDVTEDQFHTLVDVNMKGLMMVTQAVCKELIAAGVKGSIVNLSSRAATSCAPGHALYAATKAAVDCMSKAAAKEMAKYNIRINSVLPGYTNTPMMANASPDFLENHVPKSMLQRPADPRGTMFAALTGDYVARLGAFLQNTVEDKLHR